MSIPPSSPRVTHQDLHLLCFIRPFVPCLLLSFLQSLRYKRQGGWSALRAALRLSVHDEGIVHTSHRGGLPVHAGLIGFYAAFLHFRCSCFSSWLSKRMLTRSAAVEVLGGSCVQSSVSSLLSVGSVCVKHPKTRFTTGPASPFPLSKTCVGVPAASFTAKEMHGHLSLPHRFLAATQGFGP